jgi:hypothetical protein
MDDWTLEPKNKQKIMTLRPDISKNPIEKS